MLVFKAARISAQVLLWVSLCCLGTSAYSYCNQHKFRPRPGTPIFTQALDRCDNEENLTAAVSEEGQGNKTDV